MPSFNKWWARAQKKSINAKKCGFFIHSKRDNFLWFEVVQKRRIWSEDKSIVTFTFSIFFWIVEVFNCLTKICKKKKTKNNALLLLFEQMKWLKCFRFIRTISNRNWLVGSISSSEKIFICFYVCCCYVNRSKRNRYPYVTK